MAYHLVQEWKKLTLTKEETRVVGDYDEVKDEDD